MNLNLIILIVIVAAYFLIIYMKEQRLIEEGKIIKRSGAFYEEASEFTLKYIPSDQMAEAIKKIPCSEMKIRVKGTTGRIIFTATFFEAELVKKSSEPGEMVYHFQFNHWHVRNGMISGGQYMNMLLTSIEKMFLTIDPATKVRTWKLETRSKPKLF